ncbi:hypothetical protein CEUSTIGMA_g2419.t1 [Chlamydomonas eustigma]|uniref:Fungal lipase-like domain-containing protein n=1 Tax=Chlamydomonas eustigma TaxID=1157962 RepID=A0A250WVU9_9CHLO|nr:hypothetical protein CEUSTIGMA_g2419.t1 [Chlamydomonas eustigma]|eukprot:GAX74973.1 hypothetical protein CEUSTIGMA_g2419.t1 [Chlamydomonas eustigma]
MGGGIAALVALLLHCDVRLLKRVSSCVRAVCIAPASVVSKELGAACQDFIVRIVNEVAGASSFKKAWIAFKGLWRRRQEEFWKNGMLWKVQAKIPHLVEVVRGLHC